MDTHADSPVQPKQARTFNTQSLGTESIARRSSNILSNSKNSSIRNTSKCRSVFEQNEAVDHAHLVDGSENNKVVKYLCMQKVRSTAAFTLSV